MSDKTKTAGTPTTTTTAAPDAATDEMPTASADPAIVEAEAKEDDEA